MPHHQPHGLHDVLCEAPALLAMLSSKVKAALSGCGEQLQHTIHSSVNTVVVKKVRDAEAVMRGSWPWLSLIKVEPGMRFAFSQDLCLPQDSNFQLIASVDARRRDLQVGVAFIVGANAQDHQHNSIATALRHLQNCWGAYRLWVTVHSPDAEVVAQLAESDWLCLRHLKLSYSRLGSASTLQLATRSWPKLQRQSLSGNQLDEAAITANWASLRMQKSLGHIKLDNTSTHNIALLHNQLQDLDLSFTGIDAAAMSKITSQPWPQLQILDLSSNGLTADAIPCLVSTAVPNLIDLDLGHNTLNTVAARHLAKSTWPKPRVLCLDNNMFDDAAMAFLAEGSWPNLETLSLHANMICVLGLELFMTSEWPQLGMLSLDSKRTIAALWALFDLVDPMPENRSCCFVAARALSSTSVETYVVWPKLQAVCFMSQKLVPISVVNKSVSVSKHQQASAFTNVSQHQLPSASTSVSKHQPPSASTCVSKHQLPSASTNVSKHQPLSASTSISNHQLPPASTSVSKHQLPSASTSVSKHQHAGKKGFDWLEMLGWSAVASVALLIFKPNMAIDSLIRI